MDMNDYLSMFIDESNDHLQALNENLLKLESNPTELSIVQSIFRSAHTLKGMSATMGFEDLAALTHEMENVLDLVRNNKLNMDSFIFDTLFKGLDALEAMVQDIINGGGGKLDVTAIVVSLQRILKDDYTAEKLNESIPATDEGRAGDKATPENTSVKLDEFQISVLLQSLESGHQVYHVQVALRDSCVLKAVRAYMVFELLEQNGEIIHSDPNVQDIEQEKFDYSFSMFTISKLTADVLKTAILNISEIESATVIPLDEESIAMLQGESAHTAAETAAAAQAVVQAQATASKEQAQRTVQAPEHLSTPAAAAAIHTQKTIRVDIDRLDTLMNLFSEMLIDRVRLEQLAREIKRTDLQDTVEHLSRVSTDLQNIVLKLRMVQVDTVFNRFPRMVRDLAKSLDKKIDLVITGADTELDRTVIDELGDPLVHLLRNSVDHGVESREERLAAGKSETGTVYLRAYHSGNHVFIEVEEDGRGINQEKILKSAIKKGVISEDKAKSLSYDEINNLIFSAGFSTAEQISDISGRGVGLDVVRSKILSLGGNVSVDSTYGKGTKFIVELPLTLSIISAMLIKMGSEKYAIPLSSIVETAILQKNLIRRVHGTQVIEFRDAIIPLVSLSKVLGCPDFDEANEQETEIVIIRKGDKWAAVMIDEFIGQGEIVLKSLGHYLSNVEAISGATILGDGYVALIVDPNALIK